MTDHRQSSTDFYSYRTRCHPILLNPLSWPIGSLRKVFYRNTIVPDSCRVVSGPCKPAFSRSGMAAYEPSSDKKKFDSVYCIVWSAPPIFIRGKTQHPKPSLTRTVAVKLVRLFSSTPVGSAQTQFPVVWIRNRVCYLLIDWNRFQVWTGLSKVKTK